MNKKNTLIYGVTAAIFSLPAPARTAYGLILFFVFAFVVMSLTLIQPVVEMLSIEKYKKILLITFAVFSTVLCRLFLMMIAPIHAMSLGIIIYFIPVSSFVVGIAVQSIEPSLKKSVIKNAKYVGFSSLVGILFFIVREFLAYNSFSLPARYGLHIFTFPSFVCIGSGFFWASIPGAFVLLFIGVTIFFVIYRCKEIKWRMKNNG